MEKDEKTSFKTGSPCKGAPDQSAASVCSALAYTKLRLLTIPFLFLIISVSLTAQIPYEPPHLELKKAFKDASGNYVVLYKEGVTVNHGSGITAKSTWRINLPATLSDYIIASDSVVYNTETELYRYTIAGIGFSANHRDSLYFGGYETGVNPKAFIKWNGHERIYPGAKITFFDVSLTTPGKFFLVMNDTVKVSNDYGRTFEIIGTGYRVLGVNPAADGEIFGEREGILYKSVNGAQFLQVANQPYEKPAGDLVISSNGQRLLRSYYTGNSTLRSMIVGSEQSGNPFTWQVMGELRMMSAAGAEKSPDSMYYYTDGNELYKGAGINISGGIRVALFHRAVKKLINFPDSYDLFAATNNSMVLQGAGNQTALRYLTPGADAGKFYPLAVGNKFIYTRYYTVTGPEGVYTGQSRSAHTITGDTVVPQYGRFFKWDSDPLGGYQLQQYDSVKGEVYIYNPQGSVNGFRHMLKHDIISRAGDLELQYHYSINPYFTFNTSNFYSAKFGKTVGVKKYENNDYRYQRFVLTEGFGLDSIFEKINFDSSLSVLTGAVIDGVAYGDTTLTSVQDGGTVAGEFRLLGNYPNPFNGRTVISFILPVRSSIRLEIYDVTGQMFRKEEFDSLPQGLNRIDVDLNDAVSGVCFYRLTAGEGSHSASGKLLLLK
ncbi:MAG: T9SS type A sorting domain-containing protein [Ignavibacteriaceae bacterium]|nr:T9SS type A sorting domain-containing protein [Ignavibacteriaceae bacterium]